MEMETKGVKYIVVSLISILVLAIGLSVAFFTNRVTGENKNLVVVSKNISIIYDDIESKEIAAEEITPGWTDYKEFSVKNEGTDDYEYDIIIKDMINGFTAPNGLQYKITSSDDGAYNMTDFLDVPKSTEKIDAKLAYSVPIGLGKTHHYRIDFRYYDDEYIDQSEDILKTFEGYMYITDGTVEPTLANYLVSKFGVVGQRDDFSKIVTEGSVYYEDGKWTENGKKVYYYAGNSENNWVYFADKYWRIIRTNEDGGLRLLYAGSSPTAEDAYISTMAYNTEHKNTTYVGYMYSTGSSLSAIRGNGTSSPIKSTLDNWYTSDLQSYDKYISKTAIYCNDRSTQTGWSSSGEMYYNGRTKFYTNKTDNSKNHPSFKCGVDGSGKLNSDSPDAERKKDMFSVSGASGGNGALTKPIGLITADEIVFAGGFYGTKNPDAYYYRNASGGSSTGTNRWWTMSPHYFSDSGAVVFYVYGSSNAGRLNANSVNFPSGVVRPVISLKSCVEFEPDGDGSSSNPYTIKTFEDSSTCALAVN